MISVNAESEGEVVLLCGKKCGIQVLGWARGMTSEFVCRGFA